MEVQKVRYTIDDIPAIRKANNFVHVQKRNKVNVFNCCPAKTMFIKGFSHEQVKQACDYITNSMSPSSSSVSLPAYF